MKKYKSKNSLKKCFLTLLVLVITSFVSVLAQKNKQLKLSSNFFPYGILHSVRDNYTLSKDWLPDFRRQANVWGQSNVNIACVYGIGAPPNVQGTLNILGKYDIKVWGSLYMPMAYKAKLPKIVEKTEKFLKEFKDDKRIYAFAIKDEPKKIHYKLYSESVAFIKKSDSKHRIISIFCHNSSVIPYLDLMDTIAIDIYPIRDRVRDPWWIADQCADMRKILKGKNKDFVVMPPAHTFYSKDYLGKTKKMIKDIDSPTIEEFRLMGWLSIANGADGVVWFLYKWPSAWIKEVKGSLGKGIVNMIGTPGELLEEMKTQGWEMRPIGQIVAGSKVVPVKSMRVMNNKTFKLPKSDFAKIDYSRTRRSVISIYCRQHKGRPEKYYFIVNNDLKKTKKIKLKLSFKNNDFLLDLKKLKLLKIPANGILNLTIAPGDAEVLMLASTDMQKQAKQLVIKEQVHMRRIAVKARLDELERAGVIKQDSLFQAYLKNITGEANEKTLLKLSSVSKKIEQAAASNKIFSRDIKLLSEVSALWTRADNILEKRTLSIRAAKAPVLDPVCKEMLILAKKYYMLKIYIMGWKTPKRKIDYSTELTTLIIKLKALNYKLDKIIKNVPEDAKGLYSERYK